MAAPTKTLDEAALLEALIVAARDAGAEILKLVAAKFEVEIKADASPVTVCDRAAEAIILTALATAAPGVPVIAEEEAAAKKIFVRITPLAAIAIQVGITEGRN